MTDFSHYSNFSQKYKIRSGYFDKYTCCEDNKYIRNSNVKDKANAEKGISEMFKVNASVFRRQGILNSKIAYLKSVD